MNMKQYGVYDSDTLKDFRQCTQNAELYYLNEKTIAGKLHDWMELYSQDKGIHNYAINSVLFLTTV